MNRSDPLVSFARLVGDVSNPFYDEERQRDVWYEASAFGLQLMLWGSLIVATVLVWTVGEPALPYAMGLVTLLGSVSMLSIGYAQRLGVSLTGPQRMLRARMIPLLLLVLALSGGLLRAAGSSDGSSSFARGMVVGAFGAVVALAVATRRRTES